MNKRNELKKLKYDILGSISILYGIALVLDSFGVISFPIPIKLPTIILISILPVGLILAVISIIKGASLGKKLGMIGLIINLVFILYFIVVALFTLAVLNLDFGY